MSNAFVFSPHQWGTRHDPEVWHEGGGGTVFSDNFNRPDCFTVSDGDIGLGTEWTGDVSWGIETNAAKRGSGSDDNATFAHDCGPDHWAELSVIAGSGAIGGYAIVNARRPADNGNSGYLVFIEPHGNTLTMGKVVAGTYSVVTQWTIADHNDGHALRIECQGSTLRGYVDGVLVGTTADSSLSGSTLHYTGMTGSVGAKVDNFRCGPLPYTP